MDVCGGRARRIWLGRLCAHPSQVARKSATRTGLHALPGACTVDDERRSWRRMVVEVADLTCGATRWPCRVKVHLCFMESRFHNPNDGGALAREPGRRNILAQGLTGSDIADTLLR